MHWPEDVDAMQAIQTRFLNIAGTETFDIKRLLQAISKAMPDLASIHLLEKKLGRYCSAYLTK